MKPADRPTCWSQSTRSPSSQRRAGSPSPAVDDTPNGPKVLVVDDDANERPLLAGLLQMDRCRVKTANDGLEAIAFLQQGEIPDVVLLDMQMPRLGGKETFAAIRDGWRELLVFLASAGALLRTMRSLWADRAALTNGSRNR